MDGSPVTATEGNKLTRREREKLQHREQMLRAAMELFAENGYHNVSMHEIAQRAEFAIGTLYSFFNNKEDLYKALMMSVSERFQAALVTAIERGDGELEKIDNFLRAKGEVFMENAQMVRLYFAEARGASFNIKSGLDTEIRETYEKFLGRLAEVFRSGIEKGLFADFDPDDLAICLDGLANAVLLMWLRDPEGNPYQEKMKSIKQIFLGQVLIG